MFVLMSSAAGEEGNPLEHVVDHLINTPKMFGMELPVVHLFGMDLAITKHAVMMFLAATLLSVFFIPICRSKRLVPKGFRNLLEAIVVFLRTQVIEEYLDKKDARRFTPYFLTLFFFILTCNLVGLVPGGATPTGNVNVTASLAACALITVVGAGMVAQGPVKFWVNLVPAGVPAVLWPLMFVIEVIGLIAKHFALTIRLFANMTAGHIVLGVLVAFIIVSKSFLIAIPSVLGGIGIGLLEIFVAFLQAYIFTFLSAVFVGAALHPEH